MLSTLLARVKSLAHAIRRRRRVESEMSEEFRSHIELRAADLVRWGLTPGEALRQARLEFGSPERYKDEARAARGLRRIDDIRVSWLDFKLGFRMLARYPGLTVVGGLAMAFAIWMGTATFELMTQLMRPTLPLPAGEEIVGLRVWDAKTNRQEMRASYDFAAWRSQLRSVEDIGAFRIVQRNLITGDGIGEPVELAEISASAFRVTRVPPLLGRTLTAADEAEGAPTVVVIGHDLWQRRFNGDPNIIGRTLRLGRSLSTIVGVMPAGYAFPISQGLWAPLRHSVLSTEPRQGPAIRAFARLAPGVSRNEARAELTALGARMAADLPDTHEHLRPEVVPYAESIVYIGRAIRLVLSSANVPVLLLLVLICGNVALLMFARAATRETEIAVRTALGASRTRIIMQLFAEALVLGAIAAVIGLSLAGKGLEWLVSLVQMEVLEGRSLPFWFRGSVSPTTAVYAMVLTLIAAAIAGVVPALKVTRGTVTRLQQAGAGAGGMRFGGIWTAVIISQVALTVAFPGVSFLLRRDGVKVEQMNFGFRAEQYLGVRLEMDREPPPGAPSDTSGAAFDARYAAYVRELEERLLADGSVAAVTFADLLPGMYHPHRIIELDEGGTAPRHPGWPHGHRVSSASVAPNLFAALDAPIVAGRDFHAGDLDSNAVPVIVNQSFVRNVLGDRNPIGRRLRYVEFEEDDEPMPVEERGPWYEIVGVVRDLATSSDPLDPKIAAFYHPATPAKVYPAQLAVRIKGSPDPFTPRLRALGAEVDPTLRLYDVRTLDDANLAELQGLAFWTRLFAAISAVALLLSLAGIYAVMSFTVARRTREIGIRVALGAGNRRIFVAIFRRPLIQVGLGIVAGAAMVIAMVIAATGTDFTVARAVAIVAYITVMMLVCLTACAVPTRRALSVEPTEALRGDG